VRCFSINDFRAFFFPENLPIFPYIALKLDISTKFEMMYSSEDETERERERESIQFSTYRLHFAAADKAIKMISSI
jgi:hypothetical protein